MGHGSKVMSIIPVVARFVQQNFMAQSPTRAAFRPSLLGLSPVAIYRTQHTEILNSVVLRSDASIWLVIYSEYRFYIVCLRHRDANKYSLVYTDDLCGNVISVR